MAQKSSRKKRKKSRKITINPQGVLWDIEINEPIICLLDQSENCFGRCQWLSITDEELVTCQDMVIGKLVSEPKDGHG